MVAWVTEMLQKRTIALIVTAALGLVAAPVVQAYKLSPTGTPEERRIAGIERSWISSLERNATRFGLRVFGDPVHEEISNRIYGCDGAICSGDRAVRAPAAVLAGVRWNDDPPFRISSGEGRGTHCKVTQTIRFQTQPYCWYQLFENANQRAADGDVFDQDARSALLYRSHFGDLQFLHAMAARNGVDPHVTRDAILDWAEFNWRIMTGEFGLETALGDIEIPTIKARFGKSWWRVQDLYTLGSPGLRSSIEDVAFGSLLHTLQDSFAFGHVDRASPLQSRTCSIGDFRVIAPGLINEFHAYNSQDHALHAESDSKMALVRHLQEDGDVVEVGRLLLKAYRDGKRWAAITPYFECIYELEANARPSSPGEQYVSNLN